jgi:hypothetical protein
VRALGFASVAEEGSWRGNVENATQGRTRLECEWLASQSRTIRSRTRFSSALSVVFVEIEGCPGERKSRPEGTSRAGLAVPLEAADMGPFRQHRRAIDVPKKRKGPHLRRSPGEFLEMG